MTAEVQLQLGIFQVDFHHVILYLLLWLQSGPQSVTGLITLHILRLEFHQGP